MEALKSRKKKLKHNKTLKGIKLRRTIGGHWHGWIHRIPVKFVRQKGRNGKNVLWWHARLRFGTFMDDYEEKRFRTLTSAILYVKEELGGEEHDSLRSGISGEHEPVYPQEEGWE